MTVQRQIGFWAIALVVTALLLFVLRDILLPFVAGFAVAYLLDPFADRLQRWGLGRLAATLIILVLFVVVFVLALVLILPFLAHQLGAFVERLSFFFQAEDGIRDHCVTGVQTCALPI